MTASTVPAGQRIHQLFDQRCTDHPQRAFLFMPDSILTLKQLQQRVDVVEAELRSLGVLPGDRVLIVAENCPEHVALILACSRVGAWSCGINARMSRGEIAAFSAKADPRVTYFTSGISDVAGAHGQHAQAEASALPGLTRTAPRVEAVAETGELVDRVAAIIFTSGTTGESKGVLVSHAGLLQFARVSTESRGLGAADRSYAYLPMTHIFGLATVLMASIHAGAGLLMRSRFEPADVLDALAHQELSNLQGPPALFTRLLAWMDEHGVSQPPAPALRYLYTGAAPLDMGLKRAMEERFGMPLHHGYGLSEYAGALCLPVMGQWRNDTSAGYLVDGGGLRIVGPDGADLPAGETGEIWMRGVGLMPGYFRDTAATAQVMKPGGWYASGDLGRRDADGALHVVGRLKEMIIRSGFNVYPGEVESVLQAFPGVHRAAVVGRRQTDGNEEILAFIEVPPGQPSPDLAALRTHLAAHLAPYKQPSQIICMEAFPMTHSGKILKRELVGR